MADNTGKKIIGGIGIGAILIRLCTGAEHSGSGCRSLAGKIFHTAPVGKVVPILEQKVPKLIDGHLAGKIDNISPSPTKIVEEVPPAGGRPYDVVMTGRQFTGLPGAAESTVEKAGPNYAIANRKLDPSEVETLRKEGIRFIIDRETYDAQRNVTKFKTIIVASNDVAAMQELYETGKAQAEELINEFKRIGKNDKIDFVENKSELINKINDYKENGIEPLIVFHNKDNRLFDEALGDYGVSNFITCNSYGIDSKHFFETTEYLDVSITILSILKAQTNSTLFEFYNSFAGNYSAELAKKNVKNTVIIASAAITTGGGVGYIIYHNQKKEGNG